MVTLGDVKRGHSLGKSEAKELMKLLRSNRLSNLLFVNEGSRFFCTGGNLQEQIKAKAKNESYKTQTDIRKALKAFKEHRGLTLAAVDGDCFGGGMEFLSCFDVVLSTPRSFFGLWQRKLGLTFGWGGGKRLLERTSLSKVKHAALLARSVSAYEATQIGWVDEVLPKEFLVERAERLALASSALSQLALESFKSWSGEKEEASFTKLWMKRDHQMALKNFRRL
jgi:methylglutaconyl-CoA hydratase